MTEEFDINQQDNTVTIAFHEISNNDILSSQEELTQEPKLKSKQIAILVIIGSVILIGLLGLIIGLIVLSGRSDDDNLILDNVFAAGIDLSGMTVEDAISALHVATDHSFDNEDMVIRIYDDTLVLSPDVTHASLDVEAIAQTAYNYGRSGSHAENQQIRKNAHKRSYTIPLLPYLNLDLTSIKNTIDDYCASIDSVYSEPIISLEGERPVYDPDKTPKHQTLKVTLGTPLRRLDPDDLYDQVLDAYSMNELLLEYDAPEILWPSEVDAQTLFDEYCTPAQDAKLNENNYTITPESYGYGFDVNILQQMLDDARFGEDVEITFSFLIPKVLTQDISDGLYSTTLGECQSSSRSDEVDRDVNLQLSCKAINGYIIKPGETFSFLKVLGDVNTQTGYTKAPVCSINDSNIGGGISQTASALYYSALHADLEIIERHNHKYAADFIELGLDAYVDANGQDLRFRNNTGTPIRIDASFANHTVYVSIKGSKSLSYSVAVLSEIISKELPATTYQMLIPNNSQGYRDGDVVVRGVEGYQVSVQMQKTDNSSGTILSTVPVSTNEYKKRDEIIARIGNFNVDEEPQEPSTETLPLQ